MAASLLFGYDFFISFTLGPAPRGTQSYASDLARRLRERDFTVFFSEEEAPPGAELHPTLRRALHRARALIVIANEGALAKSRWIPEEVRVFRARYPNRPVIAINVGGALERLGSGVESWLPYERHIWVNELDDAVAHGIASPDVVERLAIVPRSMRANTRLRWTVGSVVSALASLTAFALFKADEARKQRDRAISRQLAAQSVSEANRRWGRSILLALASSRVSDSHEASAALLATVAALPKRVTFLWGHKGAVRSVAFSPDGSLLASGSEDGTVILWGVVARQADGHALTGHRGLVVSVCFSPDGKLLASAGEDGVVIVWDIATRSAVAEFGAAGGPLATNVAFAPDGKLLGSTWQDGSVFLWDVDHHAQAAPPFALHKGAAACVAFSPDGTVVASAGEDGRVVFSALAGCDLRPRFHEERARGADATDETSDAPWLVRTVAFSPDGTLLASGSDDETVRFWDVESGRMIGEPLHGHQGRVMSVAFSPAGDRLVSCSLNDRLILWDVKERRVLEEPLGRHDRDGVSSVAFSPDGKLLASGSGDGTVIVADMSSDKPLLRSLSAGLEDLSSVAFTPDGRYLAAGTGGHSVLMWDLGDDRLTGQRLSGHADQVLSVVFSPDGELLASADAAGRVRLWKTTTREPVSKALWAHAGQVPSLTFRRDGSLLASAGVDGTVVLWELVNYKPVRKPFALDAGVLAIAFHPNGRWLASGDSNGHITLWDLADGSQHDAPLDPHEGAVHAIAFSPEGDLLVTAHRGRTVSFLKLPGRTWLEPLKLNDASVGSVAFSPDGRLLALGSGQVHGTAGNKLIIVNVANRKPLAEIEQIWPVFGVAFSADGRLLASVGGLSGVTLMSANEQSWRALACSAANRNLSRREWRELVGNGVRFQPLCPDLPEYVDEHR
jgi:WD40 repeat protein